MKPGRLVPSVALCLALPMGPLNPLGAGPVDLSSQGPVAPATAQAQTTQQPPPPTSTTQAIPTPTPTPQPQTPPPPDNLDRIRAGVQRPSLLNTEFGKFHIYVDILGKPVTFQDLTKDYDWLNGPTGQVHNAMSHQEFLGMVTPKEMAGTGGVSAGEILTMAAVNYVGQLLVTKGVKAIAAGRKEKKLTVIQAQIDRELAALRGGK